MPALALTALLHNTALLLSVVLVYDLATSRYPIDGRPLRQALVGVSVGFLGIAIMVAPLRFETGIVFDTRSVLLAVSGLFLGAVPTVVAVLMTAAWRVLQGGAAAWTGVAVIVASGGIGIAWRRCRSQSLDGISWRELYSLGLAVHVVMLALMLTLPLEIARRVLAGIGIPVLIVFPPATAALGALLASRLRRERTATALRDSEDRYRSLFENNHAVMLVIDPAGGGIVDANPAACRFYGWTRPQLQGMPITQIYALPPEKSPAEMELARHAQPDQLFLRHRLADGSLRDVEVLSGLIAVEGRQLLYSIVHDVTGRRGAEEALRRSEEQFRAMFETASIGMAQADVRTGQWLRVNAKMCEITGYTPDEMLALHVSDITHPEDRELDWQAFERVVRGEAPDYRIEKRYVRKDGTLLWVNVNMTVIRDADGQPVRTMAAIEDVTQRKRAAEDERRLLAEVEASRGILLSVVEDQKHAEAEVRRLNVELEQRVRDRTAELSAANHELEAFSYSVSHDLRAPLRAINGYAQMLTEDYGAGLDAQGQRLLGVVRIEALRMGQLIDDLLEFSRLGRQPLRKTPTDMTVLVREVQTELLGRTPGRTVSFHLDPLPLVPADPALLRQVWLNLLDNALKYTRHRAPAAISVAGSIRGREAVYSVKDNGAGFDMKYADKLFGVFQRLHRAEEFEGTGVGLALVQRVVHRHGGRVWAEAELDRGATFYFALPIAEEPATTAVALAGSDGISPPATQGT